MEYWHVSYADIAVTYLNKRRAVGQVDYGKICDLGKGDVQQFAIARPMDMGRDWYRGVTLHKMARCSQLFFPITKATETLALGFFPCTFIT